MSAAPYSYLGRLQCSRCGAAHDAATPQFTCRCGGPLFARYRLDELRGRLDRAALAGRPRDLWRYHELLPVSDPEHALSLGEGMTPLVASRSIGRKAGFRTLLFKDESGNPTGSFKARGLSVAVARARELGARALCLPTAGNAGGALACYAARHGLASRVYLPADASPVFLDEAVAYGATVVNVAGSISDAATRLAAEREPDWYDVSTLKEPYRLEGKKTMGLELWEQLDSLPGAIIYPTGGGTGLVGMWKALEELAALGLSKGERPRMVAVQAEGCAPVVKAIREGAERVEPWRDPSTAAEGLRVPCPYADIEILSVLRASKGTAVAVSEDEMTSAAKLLAREEGILTSPEGAAAVAGLLRLAEERSLDLFEPVVVFLTGSPYKYPGFLAALR